MAAEVEEVLATLFASAGQRTWFLLLLKVLLLKGREAQFRQTRSKDMIF
jgi:hypothetical protein